MSNKIKYRIHKFIDMGQLILFLFT